MNSRITSSIGLLLILNWFNRLLGFCSIFLLARFLSPEAFGVAAMIFIAVNFVDALSNIGAEQYIIQKEDATTQDLSLAWSLNLVFKGATTLILLSSSWLIDLYYPKQQILWPLVAVSFIPLIAALANGQIYWLKKQLQLSSHVKCASLSKLLANGASIAIAIIFHSYWALIAGAILSSLAYSLLTYIIIPERTGYTLKNWRSQFDFSRWVFFRTGVGHTRAKLDTWVVVACFPASAVGAYHLIKEVALLPCREILSPIAEVFYSAIGNQKNHTEEQFSQIQTLLGVTYLLAAPIAVGWGLIAEDFVVLVLGQQWLSTIETLRILGWLVLTYAVGNVYSQIFTALGRVKSLFHYDLVTLVASGVVLLGGVSVLTEINEFAWLRVVAGIVTVVIGTVWLSRILGVSPRLLLAPLPYLLMSAAVMGWISPMADIGVTYPLLSLAGTLTLSAFSYILLVFIGCKFNLMGTHSSQSILSFASEAGEKIAVKLKQIMERVS